MARRASSRNTVKWVAIGVIAVLLLGIDVTGMAGQLLDPNHWQGLLSSTDFLLGVVVGAAAVYFLRGR